MIKTPKHKYQKDSLTIKKSTLARWFYLLAIVALLIWVFTVNIKSASGEIGQAPIFPQVEKVTEKPQNTIEAPKPAPVAKSSHLTPSQEEVADQIREIAKEMGYQAPEWLVRLARCESNLNPNSLGDGKHSRGLFQIHSGFHPTITDEQAYSIDWSTRWTITQLMNGKSYLWTCADLI
jgi:hypothetical protein